jgi:hypothetical protein
MKLKLMTILFLMFSSKLFSQNSGYTDTLWLHNKFILNKSLYENKKLKVLLDTLYKHNKNIVEYTAPSRNSNAILDTFKTKRIKLYFNQGVLAVIYEHDKLFSIHPQRKDTLNTHVPFIRITFKRLVPFHSKIFDTDRKGLGSVMWNRKLATFWGREIVEKIEIGEY